MIGFERERIALSDAVGEYFGVHGGTGRLAFEGSGHLVRGLGLKLYHRFAGVEGEVRGEDDVRRAPQRVVRRRRLDTRHVKASAAQPTRCQRRSKSLLVNDSTTRCVNEERRWLHERQLALADQVAGLRREWHVNRQRVSFSNQSVEVDGFRALAGDQLWLEIRIIRQHLHSERLDLRRERSGDLAKSKETQCLPAKSADLCVSL